MSNRTTDDILRTIVLPAIRACLITPEEHTRKLASGNIKNTLSGEAYHPEPRRFDEYPDDLPPNNKGF